jgi:hypothetical protein
MDRFIWLAIAYIGGIAAILGSFMFLSSLLLWLVPPGKKTAASLTPPWQNRLKLNVLSLAIALIGLGLLITFPFPNIR